MKRRLFIILSALSLLLFVAVCVLWVRSYTVLDQWIVTRSRVHDGVKLQQQIRLESRVGGVRLKYLRFRITKSAFKNEPGWSFSHWDYGSSAPTSFAEELRLTQLWFDAGGSEEQPFEGGFSMGTAAHRYLTVPAWLFLVIFAAAPMLYFRCLIVRRCERRLSEANRCPKCGYDLRATPRWCPECGTTSPRASAIVEKGRAL